ncbi:YppG family protein [Jeotgalibacillus proteolyticus]|uniref:Spore coat protein n=1 Tax=Jeotgalibacillus proteolyticus TaxID=2082395 RepID=A0A2S5GDV7_9BACL|nr:YppG family protein [Jeotgalibacillus proteolyticus]PPA71227.1 spore coat protein [Jeotgalibacillus proteolyticus]
MYRSYYQSYPLPPVAPLPYNRPYIPYPMQQAYPPEWMYGRMPYHPPAPVQGPVVTNIPQGQGIEPYNPEAYPAFQQPFQQKPSSSWLEIFKTEKGNVDVNKIMSTAGQMMSTAQQFGSLVKGIGSLFPKV